MLSRQRFRLRAIGLALLVTATPACLFGGTPAAGTKPPPPFPTGLTGRAGLVIGTNSAGFRRLLDADGARGAIVLFVQPDGPAEKAGISQGDVVTKIDGEPSPNAELAVAQLRALPGARTRLNIVQKNGRRRAVTVIARRPTRVNLRSLFGDRLAARPNDPLFRYLRAQTDQPLSNSTQAIEDASAAIAAAPRLADAHALRAELRWNTSRDKPGLSDARRRTLARSGLQDWLDALKIEPRNARALSGLAQALAQIRNPSRALLYARRARTVDPTLPAAQYVFGLAQLTASRYVDAAVPARRAVELNPFNVQYYELLATVFQRLNRESDCEKTTDAIIDQLRTAQEKAALLRLCG